MADNSLITQEQYNSDMKRLYDEKIYPYLNGATHTGCVPLGTIIPYFGETAPTHFLICDGTEYAKADYPELAAHLLALTNSTQYEGSDSDHFKVPDLRGEFLRGTGTNSHTNQGNGSNVGVHQNASQIPRFSNYSGEIGTYLNDNEGISILYADSSSGLTNRPLRRISPDAIYSSDTNTQSVTTRPTNTSILYCIAYQNTYIDARHNYSTAEHVVGTWIDGKPIYEKTINIGNQSSANSNLTYNHGISDIDIPLNVVNIIAIDSNNGNWISHPYGLAGLQVSGAVFSKINIVFGSNSMSPIYRDITVTVQYTKTTD